MSAETDARQKRLRKEQGLLEKVNRESDHVKIAAVTPVGGAPERYIVTFLCKGIADIDGVKEAIYANRHEVEIYCDADFPAEVPRLKWITPIWHPNIRHKEPKDVCVNRHEWLSGMYLDHLCWQMFDMVQYKNYHAEPTEPFPLDHDAAQWVLHFAEPRGIVNRRRGISVDNKPFLRSGSPVDIGRPEVVVPVPAPARPRVRFASAGGMPPGIADRSVTLPAEPAKLVERETGIRCRSCGMTVAAGSRVCGSCGSPLVRVRFG